MHRSISFKQVRCTAKKRMSCVRYVMCLLLVSYLTCSISHTNNSVCVLVCARARMRECVRVCVRATICVHVYVRARTRA